MKDGDLRNDGHLYVYVHTGIGFVTYRHDHKDDHKQKSVFGNSEAIPTALNH